jgi:DMSO reductase family type II enzyme chaperone
MNERACFRGQMYAALAQCFCKPELASAGENGTDSLAHTLQQAAVAFDEPALGQIVADLLRTLEIPGDEEQVEQALRELEIEYNRLFVGPGHPQNPPYESVFRHPRGFTRSGVIEAVVQDVVRHYAQAGLGLASNYHDLPDHVATELGFMAYLAMQEAEADDNEKAVWVERERAFLREHLGAWLPRFCRQVWETSRHPFYVTLAQLTSAFVSLDVQRMMR